MGSTTGSTTTTSTSTTTTISTTSANKSQGGMCTAYSQCGGQNWSGCTVCPAGQVCKLNGKDPWTKVCMDSTTGSTTTSSTSTTTTMSTKSTTQSKGGTCTAYSQCGGQNWSGCTSCPGDQVCMLNGKDPWTKVCVDSSTTGSTTTTSMSTTATMSATSAIMSQGDTCTAYSQCGGQNWSGCTVCPGRQVCKLNGKDPWTKVCVDPLAELSGDPSSTDAAIIV